ncbi:non-specific DNA-binding protein Dps / iron-binding ferritin-like antioxidant protein / ferroxidase [Halarchaeum acidiphilum MH1-52-1]|uniref:Non-specific DNA-binding protein Dps / iron-binding ferritin-like antioxidant protein / ferroxidase n=1 Tax=Halarchaeum acidiphilum MH1-52-1 TaxID=1261545 RepID=U3A1S2_9EURY|nr:DNA starvation/stationary phase protection protein DpsA [Halarchaeum acidiphilum]GAD51599.1 non-specific DNA-binding protein Dps / iron-binding ferritin-like antioxidant protein / ferroxidase [Halarchaeum acidiphilum MH1-52-1]
MSAPHLRNPGEDALRREWDTVGDNELRLDRADAARVVEALNADLSGLYILFNQLRKHYWTMEGAEVRPVIEFLEDAADRLSEATDEIAIRVHALGGVPVNGPMGIRQHAPMRIEGADVYALRPSIRNDLEAYAILVAQMREHVELAQDVGDETTVEILREHLRTIEEDAHDVEKLLADDTLVRAEE